MAKQYQTRRHAEIVQCLQDAADRHLTAAQVTQYLHDAGSTVGAATVYRHLERLAADGTVRKFVTGQGAPACYQYADKRLCDNHYHMRCVCCGKLIHLDCNAMREIADHIREHHRFELDLTRTVLYGRCAQCSGQTAESEACCCDH